MNRTTKISNLWLSIEDNLLIRNLRLYWTETDRQTDVCIDLGEEAAVVSGQNHLCHVLKPIQTQHVCSQNHLTVVRRNRQWIRSWPDLSTLVAAAPFTLTTWNWLQVADPRWLHRWSAEGFPSHQAPDWKGRQKHLIYKDCFFLPSHPNSPVSLHWSPGICSLCSIWPIWLHGFTSQHFSGSAVRLLLFWQPRLPPLLSDQWVWGEYCCSPWRGTAPPVLGGHSRRQQSGWIWCRNQGEQVYTGDMATSLSLLWQRFYYLEL